MRSRFTNHNAKYDTVHTIDYDSHVQYFAGRVHIYGLWCFCLHALHVRVAHVPASTWAKSPNVQVCAHVDYSNFLCTDPGELNSCFNLVQVGICWHGRFIRKWRLKFNYLLPWQLHSNSIVTSCFLHWNEVQHGFKPFRSITFFC